MSNYPAWWDKTLTVYNKKSNADKTVTWTKTVVTDCFWKYVYSRNTINNVLYETKEVICRIPEDERYLKAGAWNRAEDVTDKFTLAEGDVIVLGEVEDVIDEYTQGLRKTDLLNKYKRFEECIEIVSHTDDVGNALALPHYKVLGA